MVELTTLSSAHRNDFTVIYSTAESRFVLQKKKGREKKKNG